MRHDVSVDFDNFDIDALVDYCFSKTNNSSYVNDYYENRSHMSDLVKDFEWITSTDQIYMRHA